jgi:hypothetical protein
MKGQPARRRWHIAQPRRPEAAAEHDLQQNQQQDSHSTVIPVKGAAPGLSRMLTELLAHEATASAGSQVARSQRNIYIRFTC